MARRSKAQIRKAYSRMLGEDLVAKLSDEQISIISKYYNSLSGDESSNLDSRIMMGYSDTVLHEMARDMIDENDDSKEEDLDDLLKSIRSEKEEEFGRKFFENKLGKDVVSKLSDDQIKKLSEYYNSLPPKEREKTDEAIAKKRGDFFDVARAMAGIKFVELNENEKEKFTPDAVEVEQGPMRPPEEVGGDVYSPRKRLNTSKFFDSDKTNKELINDSIDDLISGVDASESNKLKFKKFVFDITSLKPEVEQPNQEPPIIGEQSFTASKIESDKLIPSKDEEALKPDKLIPSKNLEISEEFNEKLDELIAVIKEDNKLEEALKIESDKLIPSKDEEEPKIEPSKLIPSKDEEALKIEPSKLIPSKDEEEPPIIGEQSFTAPKIEPSKNLEISEEFNEKLDELIAVIKEDNKLEEESQKFENREKQREKRKNRENRIENKKQTKLFSINLKKGTGKVSNFFDDLKRFLTFAVLGGLVSGLYNFIMNPENNEKIEATQKFLRDNWPLLLGAAAYFLTPLGGFVNFLINTIGGFSIRLGALILKHPLLAAALGVTVATGVLVDRTTKASEQIIEREEEKAGKELTPEEQTEKLSKPSSILETFTRILLPSLNEKPQEDTVEGRSGGGLIESSDNILGFTGGGFNMGTDTVPALLTPGEIVINKPTVDAVGAEPFLALNKQFGRANANRPKVGKVMGFQGGGFVISPEERRMPGYSGGRLFGEASLIRAARAEGYRDKELSAFLAQMSHETGNFQFKRELGGGASHYGGGGPYTLPNGKVVPAKYHGRGYVQLTHDYNYKKYGDRIGVDLLNNPELALDGDISAKIAIEYWKDNVRPTVKGDWDNVFLHSKAINLPSATNPSQVRGMADRQKKYNYYLNKITSENPVIPMPTAPGSLGPAFDSDSNIKTQQIINNNFNNIRQNSSNPLESFFNNIRQNSSNPLESFVFTPLRHALSVGTPNIPTETRNFMMPPVETPKQNQSSNQTGDIPSFNISSSNTMRDFVSRGIGIHDLVGA